ncbi:MAG: amidohydrolase family protein [Gemmatimonadota bacterium]
MKPRAAGGVLVLVSCVLACGPATDMGPSGVPTAISLLVVNDTLAFVGATERITVRAVDESGRQVDPPALAWASRSPNIVSVDALGVVTALADGHTYVVATGDGLVDSVRIAVVRSVASVSVTPPDRRFSAVGQERQYEASALDAGGIAINGITMSWSSSNPSVASVSPNGLVTAVENGVADLLLTLEGQDVPIPLTVAAPVLFENATVLSIDAEQRLDSYDVLVSDGVIEQVGPTGTLSVPAGAFLVDGTGRTLMPGLADMHVHLSCNTGVECANDFFLYLANGVTTVRPMWGSGFELRARDDVEAGRRLAPTLRVASPGMDGPGGGFASFTPPVTTVAQARSTVRQHVEAGYDFIKVYNRLSDPVYASILEEADALGVPVIGHKPFDVTHASTVARGQWTSEHLLDYEQETTPTRSLWTSPPDLDQVRLRANAASAASMGVTPTFAVMGVVSSELPAHRASNAARYVSPGIIGFSTDVLPVWNVPPGQRDLRVARSQDIVRVLHEEGVPILLGTDAGVRWTIPGFSIHDELAALVGSGLTPFEALRSGTVAAATFLDEAGVFGDVVEGFRADLVLLDGDPSVDIDALRQPRGVMTRGVWISREEIDRRLEAIASGYGR